MLCVGRVPVVPIHTTTAMCSTAVRSSLGSSGLPQWGQTQEYASNVYWFTPVSSCCSWQTQGVVGMALNRQRELRVRCTASASRSSTEAASSVLSTSPKSWIACVGRGNSSTWQKCLHNQKVQIFCEGSILVKCGLLYGGLSGSIQFIIFENFYMVFR